MVALSGMKLLRSGKVRDIYAVGDDRLLLVASDRVSTYDVIHPTPVPDKGRVLTGVSSFWFDHLADVVDNHLVSTDMADFGDAAAAHAHHLTGRSMLVERLDIVAFECVVRGYLVGSGWHEYQADGTVCGIELPDGLVEADQLPAPIFTPATKAQQGDHDVNVTYEYMAGEVGEDLAGHLRDLSIELYSRGAALAAKRGIILADTKFEFGLRAGGNDDGQERAGGEVVLADEVLTPDSSRYWPADRYEPGSTPPSFDKQFVRDYATSTGWDKHPPAPELPDDVVEATRAKYIEAYERITGTNFST